MVPDLKGTKRDLVKNKSVLLGGFLCKFYKCPGTMMHA